MIVPWWGYFPAYPYPGYPASPTQGDLVPDYSDPASSAVAYDSYGSTVAAPSYSMSITSALRPPAPPPDSADATLFPGDAEAELANCQATWVDGYYDTRVWPNGQPETFWVGPRLVCQ